MAISLIAPLASTALSFGASKLFGGGSSSNIQAPIPKLNAGGLSAKGGTVTSSPQRQGFVSNVAGLFGKQGNLLSGLREQVAPGFGRLTSSRLAEVESARQRSIGNLRDNLARRRVLGSSFAQDAIVRGEMEFAKEAERVQAESFLQELELTDALIGREFEARRGEFQTFLDELNLQAEVGTQLASSATAQLGANARLKAELDAKASAGAGRFFGQAFQPAIDKFAGSFSGSGGSDPWAGLRTA